MARSADKQPRPVPSRHSERGRWVQLGQHITAGWQRLLEMRSLWLVIFVALATWSLIPRELAVTPQLVVGTPADRDYIAPEDLLVPDEETTLERQQKAREEVMPVWDLDRTPVVLEQIKLLFERGRALLDAAADTPRARRQSLAEVLLEESALRLEAAQVAVLEQQGFAPELEERMVGLASQIYRQGVVESKQRLLAHRGRAITVLDVRSGEEYQTLDIFDHLDHPEEVREQVEAELRDWMGLSGSQRRALADLLVANIQPNLGPNQNETVMRQEAAALATSTSFSQVRKGEVIVRRGDIVNSAALRKINAYHTDQTWRERLLPILGTVLLLTLLALVVGLALQGDREERVSHHSERQLFSESLLILTISIVGARLMLVIGEAMAAAFESPLLSSPRAYVYAVPFAALGLSSALLLGRQAAFILSAVFSLIMGHMLGAGGFWLVLYALAGSLAAIYALDRYQVRQRVGLVRIGLFISFANVAVVLILFALSGDLDIGPLKFLFYLGCAAGGGMFAVAVASFANPVFESALGITTDIKLAELANTNLPLLRRLAFEAPGSFQHSMMVANLAKQACESIGADSSLAYTGGLYHDVGKVFRSEYFIENQRGGTNPHDKLQPTMSALVLISHVKDGVQLAREHHLPQPLIEAIKQHHGTRLIKYFYSRAKEQAGEGVEVREEKFRYPGPQPQNKVMGVLMLADAVEAASRTLIEPSALKIRTLIRTIVEDCLQDGQLDETDLTLSDLRQVAEAFMQVLSNIFHQRVDYPGFDFNAGPGGKSGAKSGGRAAAGTAEKPEKTPRLAAVGGQPLS